MACKTFAALLLACAATVSASAPAAAQFGWIFGNEPPRPPGNVPGHPAAPPPEPQQVQPQPPPQQLPPVPANLPPPATHPGTGIQSQPLPPPPGSAAAPAAAAPQQSALPPGQSGEPAAPVISPLPGLPPGQRQPRGNPANSAPQPGDEVVTEMPSQKIANTTAVFSGLDKITGRIIKFDVAINETVQFGALQVTPRVCYTRPPTETPNTDAFAEVDEVTLQGEVRRIFTGWMFASSPGLHAVEHPIYDIWLTDCKSGNATVADAPAEPAAQPAAAPKPAASSGRKPARQARPQQPSAAQSR